MTKRQSIIFSWRFEDGKETVQESEKYNCKKRICVTSLDILHPQWVIEDARIYSYSDSRKKKVERRVNERSASDILRIHRKKLWLWAHGILKKETLSTLPPFLNVKKIDWKAEVIKLRKVMVSLCCLLRSWWWSGRRKHTRKTPGKTVNMEKEKEDKFIFVQFIRLVIFLLDSKNKRTE
jgi:hypothetical protein